MNKKSQILNEVLQGSLDLFKDPNAWHQNDAFAMDANGKHVSASSEDACSWCLAGGINRILEKVLSDRYEDYDDPFIKNYIMHKITGVLHEMNSSYLKSLWSTPLIEFNECGETTYDDVISLLEKCLSTD